MTALITLLISILGYGTPSDFSHMNEDQLNTEIAIAEAVAAEEANQESDGGSGGDNVWDVPYAPSNP